MQSIVIDKEVWKRGINISDDHAGGGFSPRSGARGQNLKISLGGILRAKPATVDLSANVTTEIIAFTADAAFLGNDGYAVDTGGRFYTINGSTVTLRQTDAVKAYTSGNTYLKTFLGSLYATSTTDIAKLDNSDLTVMDNDWWTATQGEGALQSSWRHPMEVVEDTLYIADQYYIHTWDGTTSVYAAMTLPVGYNITSIIVHTDGRHLLVFMAETANFSHTKRARAKMFMVDTVNLEFVREIDIDAQVEGTINVGGVIYCTYGMNLGYFNGDGLTFLRKLENQTTYSNNLANMEGDLIIREKNGLLAYGNLGEGNVFWYPWTSEGSNDITAIFYAGDNCMITSAPAAKLDKMDFDTFAGIGRFESGFISFPGKVWIRKVEVITETLISGDSMLMSAMDKNNNSIVSSFIDLSFNIDGAISEKVKFVNFFVDIIKFRLIYQSGNLAGVKKIIIYYEDGE